MIQKLNKNAVRKKRHYRMRKNIIGSASRPRLNVYRSTGNIYAQVIDDAIGSTLVFASTLDAEIKPMLSGKTKKEAAEMVGQLVGKRAVASGITKVVYDRGGYNYTGRVAMLAKGAREAGLQF